MTLAGLQPQPVSTVSELDGLTKVTDGPGSERDLLGRGTLVTGQLPAQTPAMAVIYDAPVGARQHPGSNHWGMQVGGAALALLAVMNDPGVDMGKIAPLLKASEKSMIINVTQGFGDGGFFAEGELLK